MSDNEEIDWFYDKPDKSECGIIIIFDKKKDIVDYNNLLKQLIEKKIKCKRFNFETDFNLEEE